MGSNPVGKVKVLHHRSHHVRSVFVYHIYVSLYVQITIYIITI